MPSWRSQLRRPKVNRITSFLQTVTVRDKQILWP
jgi:hypothetical protein